MNEIMRKTYELIDVLEDSDLIRDLEMYRTRIMDDEVLSTLIREGNSTKDEYVLLDIKRRLYLNKNYKGYMDKYNELMYLVMDINYRYRKLLGKGSCHR
ncbi:MAG: YlbF family regulator [Erysipelotrichaceae bacterium]|nr:YlbF family regulator [Erysipelotrichaceae bacterium]